MMENKELQQIWRSMDKAMPHRSKDELNLLLTSKTKQTLRKFLLITALSTMISAGVLIFLIITSLQRQHDPLYLLNNALLGLFVLFALISGVMSWLKLRQNRYDQPLISWLAEKIAILSSWLSGWRGRHYLFIMPPLYLLTVLSIHVYFEYKTFMEVMRTEESVVGLIVALPVGLFVSYYAVSIIRKYQKRNLEFLKDLYTRLSSI
jgi:RsiW-degrading membrane proteinase PrsW (M82 family)